MYAFAAAPVAVVLGIELMSPWALVTEVPRPLYFFAGAIGFVYAFWVARDMLAREGFSNGLILPSIAVFGIYSIGVMPYLLRSLIMLLAFLGNNAETEMRSYVIERGDIARIPGGHGIWVNPYHREGRSTRVRTTYELASEHRNLSERGRHCIRLQTQVGRRGVVRVHTHSVFGGRQTGQQINWNCV